MYNFKTGVNYGRFHLLLCLEFPFHIDLSDSGMTAVCRGSFFLVLEPEHVYRVNKYKSINKYRKTAKRYARLQNYVVFE